LSRRKLETTAPATVHAIGYIRVSTNKQAMSPEVQEQKIRAMAAMRDIDLVELVTDKETAKEGSLQTRPGIQRIFELARQGKVNRIIVAKLDRMTRSVVDLGGLLTRLDKTGVSFASVEETWMDTGSAIGRLIINIITSVAQWELEVIGERTTAVLQFKRQHRQVYNHPPYGYARSQVRERRPGDCGAELVEIPAELAIVAEAASMRAGGLSYQAIAFLLNKRTVPTKRPGGKWFASTVSGILRLSTIT